MKRVVLSVLIICLAMVGLFVSCKNDVEPIQESEKLVSVGFSNSSDRALTSNLEAFNPDEYYWKYAADKADTSRLKSGETASYDEAGAVWVKSNDNVPVKGLGSVGTSGYQAYRVAGFSQGLWNFKLYAYKDVSTTQTPDYKLVYQGETTGVLLKSESTNAVANHTVNVIVSPVSSGNGTLKILTASSELEHITMTLLKTYASEAPEYGVDYFPRVLSIKTLDETTDYTSSLTGGTKDLNGTISLPAGTYKVTVAFSDKADSSATVNYAKGSVVATVYSNLTTTIKGNLLEADVSAEFASNQSIDTVTDGEGFEEATIAAAPAATNVEEPGTEHASNTEKTESAKTTITSTTTAVTEAEDKKTTVTIPAAGLADTVVTKTLEQKTDESNKVVITETTSSTHDLSMKVTDATATTPSTVVISTGSTKVAGVNLTLTKTTTTVTETATTTSGSTNTVTTSTTADPVTITSFNSKYVTVSTYIDTGLVDVNVLYDGTSEEQAGLRFGATNSSPSVEVASTYDDDRLDGTGYNPTTGLLVFKTNHFSSYIITCAPALVVTNGQQEVVASYASLAAFRDAVNSGTSFAGQTVTLQRDVDLSGISWTPIGTSSKPFRGTFNGNHHKIDNLSNRGFTSSEFDGNYNSGSENAFALFGYVRGDVTIKDVTVNIYAADKSGKGYAGIVGLLKNDSGACDETTICNLTLSGITVNGAITAADKVAGVIAQSPTYGSDHSGLTSTLIITGCTNNATITGERASGILSCGGAAGGKTTITGCVNNGNLTSTGTEYNISAGIVAHLNTTDTNLFEITGCSNTGVIDAAIGYNIAAVVFMYYPADTSYTYSRNFNGQGHANSPATLMSIYNVFKDGPYSEATAVRWKDIEPLALYADHTGLLAGIAYELDSAKTAEFTYVENDVTYPYKFDDTAKALSRLNSASNYNDLKLFEDATWTSAYTKYGDAPGNYSIDLGGNVLTLEAPVHSADSKPNGLQKTVTIKNGTIEYGGTFSAHMFDHVERYGRIDFSNVTLGSSVPSEIISIYPSTSGYDPITINIDPIEGFFGKKIRCLSPTTSGGDVLILNGETIPMTDSRWVADGNETLLTIQYPQKHLLIKNDVTGNQKYMSLTSFRDSVNAGNTYAGYTVTLQEDVDLQNINWTPIGTTDHPFSGVFDGNEKTISNYVVNSTTGDDGLFGCVRGTEQIVDYKGKWDSDSLSFDYTDLGSEYTAVIKDLTVENASVTTASTKKATGAVVGSAIYATISNITVKNSTVIGEKGVGGVIGNIDGSFIEGCSTDRDTSVTSRVYNVGGIVGITANDNSGNVTKPSMIYNCSNFATVTINGTTGYAGGILGNGQNAENNVIADCQNYGKVKAANIAELSSPALANSGMAGIAGSANGVYLLLNCVNENSASFEVVITEVQNLFNSVAGISFYGSGKNYVNCVNKAEIRAAANKIAGITVSENAKLFGCSNEGTLVNTLIPSAVYELSSDMKVINIQNQNFNSISELNNQIAEQFSSAAGVVNVVLKDVTINNSTGTGTLVVPNGIQTIASNVKVCDKVELVASLYTINMVGLSQEVSGERSLVFGGSNNTIAVAQNSSMGNIVLDGSDNHVVNNGSLSGVSILGSGTNLTIENNGLLGHLSIVASTANVELTNNGSINNANGNGIHVESACTLVINTHGQISANSFAMLLYDGCNVTINAYADSVTSGGFAPYRGNNTIQVYYQEGATINGKSWTTVASENYHVTVSPM